MTARFSLENLLSLVRPQVVPPPGADLTDAMAVDLPPALNAPRVGGAPACVPDPGAEQAETQVDEALFIPEAYEPNYAYPLIVWLQSGAEAGQQLDAVMPQISLRNYIGVSVTIPDDCAAGHSAEHFDEMDALAEIEQRLFATVTQVRRRYHIHTERVFLVGFDRAGTLALRIGLHRPEWFAGVAAFAAQFPAARHALIRYRDLRGKRVLLGVGQRDAQLPVEDVRKTGQLLHTAGLRVCVRSYDAGHEMAPTMLSEIDRWVMREIYQPKPAKAKMS